MGLNFWQARKALNLLRLLENETMEMLSVDEWIKSLCLYIWCKICEADKVREDFINTKIENEAFG